MSTFHYLSVIAAAWAMPAAPTLAQSEVDDPFRGVTYDFVSQPAGPATAEEWRTDLTLWVWMLGVDGDIGAGGLTTDTSANFGDILDASDSIFAFSGRLEVGTGRWGGFIDGIYGDIGVDDVIGPAGDPPIDVRFEETILDFGVTYRLHEWQSSESEGASSTLDLYVGGRYTDIDLELDPDMMPSVSGSEEWLDPIVGAKLVHPVSDRWRLSVNGDVGGFGIESDLTWSATGVIGYDFTMFDCPATLHFGYRAIGWDFEDDGFTWDLVQHGPLLGVSIAF